MRAVLACIALAGCALTTKLPPLPVRYFSPDQLTSPAPDGESSPISRPVAVQPDALRVRLGRITPSAHLRYSIVHRAPGFELEPYEQLRWTERPDAYVRRALERELFDDGELTQAVAGRAPTLDVDVIAFEEVRRGARRSGRVELRYELTDDTAVLTRGVVTVERDARGARIEDVVAAISSAMTLATRELARRIERACTVPAASGTTASACLQPRTRP